MHILIIASSYPSAKKPLSGIFYRQQASALHNAGHRVGIIVRPKLVPLKKVFSANKSEMNSKVEKRLEEGISVYSGFEWSWIPNRMLKYHVKLMNFAGHRIFQKYLAENGKPDIIHAHRSLYGGYLAAYIKQKWGIPFVLTEHSSAFIRKLIPNSKVRFIKTSLKHADKIFAVSPILVSKLQEYCSTKKVDVLGNLIDTDFFIPKSENIPNIPFVFSTIALLEKNKGIDLLIDAFNEINNGKTVILNIAGSGKDKASLEKKTEDFGLNHKIKFLGLLSREKIRDLIQKSHVIVSSSYFETFGVTLAEAMSCGKPVIATRSGGPESFVSSKNGILVSSGDKHELAGAMKEIIQNYYIYNDKEIRADCESMFGTKSIVTKLENTYAEILNI